MSFTTDDDFPFYTSCSQIPSIYNRNRKGYKEEDIDLHPLIEAASQLLGSEIVSAVRIGGGLFNVVYSLEKKSGEPVVARIQWHFKTDNKSLTWTFEKMSREIAVLELIRRVKPDVPVPRVLAYKLDITNPVQAPFMIMNRLYGEDQWMAWPKLSAAERVTFVKSFAVAMVGIFQIQLPSIGCVVKLTSDGRPIIGSPLPYTLTLLSDACGTIDEYITQQLEDVFTRDYDQTLYDFSVPDLVDRLRSLAKHAIPRDDPAMTIPVLVHKDLNSRNVMIKDGMVSGILDWESHVSAPACLGASYPGFIRFDGVYDPKYGLEDRLMPTKEAWTTEEEALTLRNIFREAAAALSPEFVRALDKGEVLRQLSEMLPVDLNDPPTMLALQQWAEDTSATYHKNASK